MADIARIAGVSVTTVSRALAGSPLVTGETQRRIDAAVGDTGYVVNHVARGLRLQRSHQILVILPSIANPYFAEIVLGVEEEARSRRFGVLVGNTSGAQDRVDALARHVLTGSVDGLILVTGRLSAGLAGAIADDKIVSISARAPVAGETTVSIDNAAAAREAVAHLVALGHRRIAHVAGPPGSPSAGQRLIGYRDALARAGLRFEPDLLAGGEFSFATGSAAMARFLALRKRPTAIFCGSDEIAIGVIRAARAGGLHVPRDLSVVGFDDVPIAAVYDPALTTIQLPRREMGREAAKRLLDKLLDTGRPHDGIELGYRLVVRDSSGPAPA